MLLWHKGRMFFFYVLMVYIQLPHIDIGVRQIYFVIVGLLQHDTASAKCIFRSAIFCFVQSLVFSGDGTR